MRNRMSSLLLVIAMVVGMLSTMSFAVDVVDFGTCGENVAWLLDSDGVLTITGEGIVEGGVWNDYIWSIKHVVVEDGITEIGTSAFSQCHVLQSIDLPSTLESIGDQAFWMCRALSEVDIPSAVTRIGNSAFYSCAFTSIELPETLMEIAVGAFQNCDRLSAIVIPSQVKCIEHSTFYNCKDLERITFSCEVTEIGKSAFYGCSRLKEVHYGGNENQRRNITIGDLNTELINAVWFCEGPEFLVALETINGSQIRTRGVQGLRFISTIDKMSADFRRVEEYGMVLIPSEDITDISELQVGAVLNGHKVAKVPAQVLYDETDTTITFTAVITNIAEKNYAREYTARAYAILDDGSVVYADSGASRSIYAVAKRGLENPNESEENKEIFQNIVDTVENS